VREDAVTNRLQELRKELEKGRQRLEDLDHERRELRDTMLRIAGAIQVLEELLAHTPASEPDHELAAASM
jgi:predicted nuclease with TOPRIM domain